MIVLLIEDDAEERSSLARTLRMFFRKALDADHGIAITHQIQIKITGHSIALHAKIFSMHKGKRLQGGISRSSFQVMGGEATSVICVLKKS